MTAPQLALVDPVPGISRVGRRRPGRPALPTTSARTSRLASLITGDEHNLVLHAAARRDQTNSDWLRDAALAAATAQTRGRELVGIPVDLLTDARQTAERLGISVQDLVVSAVAAATRRSE